MRLRLFVALHEKAHAASVVRIHVCAVAHLWLSSLAIATRRCEEGWTAAELLALRLLCRVGARAQGRVSSAFCLWDYCLTVSLKNKRHFELQIDLNLSSTDQTP